MMSKKAKAIKRAKMKAKGSTADIYIYDDIGDSFFGGISAQSFADDLKALGNGITELNVFINSMGGSVFEGLTIYNLLARHQARVNVVIDGMAASIASLIAMAGDHISIAKNAMMMIHKPMGGGIGTADDLREVADALDMVQKQIVNTYVARTGSPEDKIIELVNAETWMASDVAAEWGFVDEVTAAKKLAAFVDVQKHNFKNMPEHLPSAIYTVEPEPKARKKYADILDHQKRQLGL